MALYYVVQPVGTILLAHLIFDEPIYSTHLIGVILILVGLKIHMSGAGAGGGKNNDGGRATDLKSSPKIVPIQENESEKRSSPLYSSNAKERLSLS